MFSLNELILCKMAIEIAIQDIARKVPKDLHAQTNIPRLQALHEKVWTELRERRLPSNNG